jgi:lysophospholipase L1-like esterase
MGATVVACLGSSSTAARGLYDWIDDVAGRPGNENLRFQRFAAGGDLSYNGLARLDAIATAKPWAVIVLLGGNDVLATVFPKLARVFGGWKRLPRTPSTGWYRENMQAIVRDLTRRTSARIALCSLQPIGEAPESTHPVQAKLNRLVAEHNQILRDIAGSELVTYLPFYERFEAMLKASPGKAFTRFDFASFYRDLFRQYVWRLTNDEIAERNGWKLHRDGIHLNTPSGRLLADLVDDFLRKHP